MISTASLERTAADRLIEATLESIHKHGLGDTSVTTVTDIAGLSRGMVRHQFGSKQRMVIAAMDRLCDTWLATTEPDPTQSGPNQVRTIVRAMFAPEIFTPVAVDAWVALSVEARSDHDLHRLRNTAQQRWVAQLTRAFTTSGVQEPDAAARGLMATADGLWLQQRLENHSTPSEQALTTALRVADALLV